MRVFLDVGAHYGETAAAVLDPKYGFDRVICFEPVAECWQRLEALDDPRVVVNRFGLWKDTCELPMFSPGLEGASMFWDKNQTESQALCEFVQASTWVREHVSDDDTVFMKMNVEGAESDIIEDLLDSGEYKKIAGMLVYADAMKIPSQRHRATEIVARLQDVGYGNFIYYSYNGEVPPGRVEAVLAASLRQATMTPWLKRCRYLLRGTSHVEGVQSWLDALGARSDSSGRTKSKQLAYATKQVARRCRESCANGISRLLNSNSCWL